MVFGSMIIKQDLFSMSEQTKMSQSIKLILVGKKKTSGLTDSIPKLTRGCSQKTDVTTSQECLAQDVRKLNLSVNKLEECILKLTEAFIPLLRQAPQTPKRSDNGQLKEFKKYSQAIQPRDRKIEISPSDKIIEDGKLNKQNIERWASKMFQFVFSSAFRKFQKKELSGQQTKIYCSQNIINNIVGLSQKYEFTVDQWKRILQIIDTHIKEQVCPYMLAKYPLTQTKFHKKSLESRVKEVDNLQSYKNNIFYTSSKNCFDFEYRSSGNYNDLIMKFVNQLLERIDKISQISKKTIYQQFQEQMTQLFQTVINKKTKVCGSIQPKKNLKQKTKKEASLTIGRKLQENVPKYTQRQIKNMEFQIKHPSILRILTKWCRQLYSKFEPDYFLTNFNEIFNNKKNSMINVTEEIRKNINLAMAAQKEEIDQYLNALKTNNFEEQSSCLKSALQDNHFTNMDKIESSSGIFVVNTVNDLHSYIILYLNKLIHKLLWVGKHVGKSQVKLNRLGLIPNLLSFTICDLMRCRIQSREQDINDLYEKIMEKSKEKSKENHKQFKVVKVKNRLKNNTNDIQIAVLFKEKYLCEIQLKVDSEQSNFMKCSNKFNHFVYQLRRSIFGPISELCSIRKSLDSRIQIYQKMACEPSEHNKKDKYKVECKNGQHQLKATDLPFQCSECGQSSANLSCFYSHKQCEKCSSYWKCGRCGLKSLDQQKLKQSLFEQYDTSQENLKLMKENEQIPQYGIFFPITQKVKNKKQFTKIKYKQAWGIYVKKQDHKEGAQFKDNFVNFTEFSEKNKNQEKFKKANIIFAIKHQSDSQKITANQVKHFFLKKAIQSTYIKEKQHICIMNEDLNEKFCQSILQDTNDNIKKIELIDLTLNRITNLQFVNKFTNLKRLFLKKNKLDKLKDIQSLGNLQVLFINDNLFKTFPEEVFKLKKLKELNISDNIVEKLPIHINQLTQLQKLMASNIQLKQLPQSIKSLKLKHIVLSKNLFDQIPDVLNIPSLQILVLNQNKIKQIKDWLYDLQNLRVLELNDNPLASLSQKINKMDNLEKLQLRNNCLTELKVQLPKNLRQIDLSFKDLSQISRDIIFNCTRLNSISFVNFSQKKLRITPVFKDQSAKIMFRIQEEIVKLIDHENQAKIYFPNGFLDLNGLRLLNLSGYKVKYQKLQNLYKFKNLQQLQLSRMQLSSLPKSIKTLTNLNHLDLSSNNLTKLEAGFFENLIELTNLDLSHNQFETISDSKLEKCKNLKILNLSHNKFKRIKLNLECFKKLTQVYLANNEEIESIQLEGQSKYLTKIGLSSKQKDKVEHNKDTKIKYSQIFEISDEQPSKK